MAALNKVTWVCGWFHGKLSEKDEHYVESTASPVLHVVIHRLTHTHTLSSHMTFTSLLFPSHLMHANNTIANKSISDQTSYAALCYQLLVQPYKGAASVSHSGLHT